MPNLKKTTLIILSLGCIGFTIWNLIKYMVNIPNADDYGVFLGFINGLESDVPVQKKIDYFFSQQNEHRPFISRLISFLQFHITGKVNFTILMIIGNLMWITGFYLLIKKYKLQLFSLPFLFLVVLFFNMTHWENMLWATGSLQNFGVILFSLAAFYYTTLKTRHQILALVFSGLAFYSSGNGLFTLLITSGFILFHGNWKVKLITLIYASGLIFLYFMNYKTPEFVHSPLENLIDRPIMVIEYILTYFAGPIYLIGIHDYGFILITGALIIILSLFVLYKSFRTDWFTTSIILFCLLSGLSAGTSRADFGYLQAVTPRYQVIDSILYFSVGLFLLKNVQIRWYILVTSVVLCCSSFIFAYMKNQNQMINYYHKYLKTAYCHNKTTPTDSYVYPIPVIGWIILVQSEELNTYTLPKMKGEFDCNPTAKTD